MDIFAFRDHLVEEYAHFSRSFTRIAAPDIKDFVDRSYSGGAFWPPPIIQLKPSFVPGATQTTSSPKAFCTAAAAKSFACKSATFSGTSLRLHQHHEDAIRIARTGACYVLTTGKGSGKSLSTSSPSSTTCCAQKTTP